VTRYRVCHVTKYRYGVTVTSGQTIAHLAPRTTARQRPLSWEVSTQPVTDDFGAHVDAFGNTTTYFAITHPHDTLVVTATSEVEVGAPAPWPQGAVASWEQVAAAVAAGTDDDHLFARRCRLDSPLVVASPALREYAEPSFPAGRPADEAAVDLLHRIFRDFTFDAAFSDVSTPLAEVLLHRRGVCQDFAHLMIGCLRTLGLAARYVSGYIETDPPPGKPKLVGADASHAWCSLYLPPVGWLDLDPTNDLVDPSRHVTVAWGRDYSDVAPLRGVVFGPPGAQRLDVSVDVRRVSGG